ncbi:hypothetical protein SiRe_1071 [Sulfolobus islandicus REY15A]|uniref:Uncharacterized protein n=1 Tax=Saccharolobus islandicus (strain REY15A) TaxID=930945 RepID=F0NHB7_SACI5|nr:hypothetical protein SiRe_1071 [Sulfolobus islandicus REY15A]
MAPNEAQIVVLTITQVIVVILLSPLYQGIYDGEKP